MGKIDETVLLGRVSVGDRNSFDQIYNVYYTEIHRYVFKFIKSSGYTDDLCQEVFIKVWEKRETLQHVQSFRAYLYTVAKNHVFDFLRHASVERSVREEILKSSHEGKNSVDDNYQSEEYRMHLLKVLDSMSPRNQEVFRLCRDLEHSYDEAAEVLGVSRNAIKKHMVKTMKLLKYSAQKSFGLSFNSFLMIGLLFDF